MPAVWAGPADTQGFWLVTGEPQVGPPAPASAAAETLVPPGARRGFSAPPSNCPLHSREPEKCRALMSSCDFQSGRRSSWGGPVPRLCYQRALGRQRGRPGSPARGRDAAPLPAGQREPRGTAPESAPPAVRAETTPCVCCGLCLHSSPSLIFNQPPLFFV